MKKDLKFIRTDINKLKQKIIDISIKLGKTPSYLELRNHDVFVNINRFNYNEMLEEIGLQPNLKMVCVNETNEELLKMYKDFCSKLGRVATANDLNESDGIYNSNVFAIRFGGLNNLRRLAGYDEYERVKKRYSKTKIMNKLKEEYLKKGMRLTMNEIDKIEEIPNHNTLLYYFGTTKLSDIWEEIEKELLKDYIKKYRRGEM